MKKHKLLSISAVIMMLSAYGCSLMNLIPPASPQNKNGLPRQAMKRK